MVSGEEDQMTGVRGVQPAGDYRFISAALYDVRLEHEDAANGTPVRPSLTAALGGFTIDDDGHSFSAVMRLTVESPLPGRENHIVKLTVGVIGYWISAEPLTAPINGEVAVDRLFPYAKAYAEQFLGQAQLDLPPIPDMADVPFADADEVPTNVVEASTDERAVATQ